MKVLLSIEDLHLNFRTFWGTAYVLDGVNLQIYEDEVFGLVGETGCGKSVTSMSILKLLPSNAEISGRIMFQGKDLLQLSEKEIKKIRGKKISMVFQDPMSSLNPLFKIKTQIVDIIRLHH